MSGKAPPRAPRALLNSFVPSAGSSTAAQPSNAPSSSRLGATPPTGPRSLTQRASTILQPPTAPSKYVNGHSVFPSGPAGGAPPKGPSAMRNKGKQFENSWNGSSPSGVNGCLSGRVGRVSSSVHPSIQSSPSQAQLGTQVNGIADQLRDEPASIPVPVPTPAPAPPTAPRSFFVAAGPSSLNNQPTGPARKISIRLRPQPPQPTTEPPPPPPPSSTPPPPPPPPIDAPPPPPPPGPPPPNDPLPPPPPPSGWPPSPPPPPPSDPPAPAPDDLICIAGASSKAPSSTPPPPAGQPPSPPPPPSEAPPLPPQEYILPEWPPPLSECPEGKDFKVLFDSATDRHREAKLRPLIDLVQKANPDRVKGKPGKEMLVRYNGEFVEGEPEPVPRDPRKDSKVRSRPPRTDFYEIKYEYDANSAGPAPPAAVLVLNLSPLTPNQTIRRHFSSYGPILSFEPQINTANGAALGIVLIRFSTHEEAKRCVEKEHGKRGATGIGNSLTIVEGEELKVVLDGEGKKLAAVMKGLDHRRRRDREERRRAEEKRKQEGERKKRETSVLMNTPSTSASHTPASSAPWRPSSHPSMLQAESMRAAHFTPHSSGSYAHFRINGSSSSSHLLSRSPATPSQSGLTGLPTPPIDSLVHGPARIRRAPQYGRMRDEDSGDGPPSYSRSHAPRPPLPPSHSSSAPSWRGRRAYSWRDRDDDASVPTSRSPSPIRRRGGFSRTAKQREHEAVVEELAKNGYDYVTLEAHGGQLSGAVREEDVKKFFTSFEVDKVLQDHIGWYVTFKTADTARRAAMFLNTGRRTLNRQAVNVIIHAAPSLQSLPSNTTWTDSELIEQAEKLILKDLRALLQQDVVERIVTDEIRRVMMEERSRGKTRVGAVPDGKGVLEERNAVTDPLVGLGISVSTGLKGLSFRKQKKYIEEPKPSAPQTPIVEESELPPVQEPEPTPIIDEELAVEEPPRKKPKKVTPKTVADEDIESEDDMPAPIVSITFTAEPTPPPRKRAPSVSGVIEEPPKKKSKKAEAKPKEPKKSKKSKKAEKAQEPVTIDELIHEVIPNENDFAAPALAHVRVTPTYESSPEPSVLPVQSKRPPKSTALSPPKAVNPFDADICADDEDEYFAKLALDEILHGIAPPTATLEVSEQPTEEPRPFRVHVTGSARTEGYYKIPHAEKSAYVAQYVTRTTANETNAEEEPATQPKNVTSSRSNRANARRRAQGLEEMNQVQLAMALSKGENAATELVKFNQLQTRKKHLRFARSPIHDWGLYAMEKISRGEMVIEYVGEIIRAQVADKREKAYERQGIGSSYLFRIDEDLVVDATKKGNLGRLINHSCDPNCTAKIITINSEKKIVIYAKQDIELGSEITYDYHFPIEQDKIPCLCGSAKCRGYLN
ncbi:uncharacterized protein PHACADRAFT_142398 [Phanerochaete carnosa HHB-10118-sp]|uniref:Histone-lysine N-methyltransferase, H3 lysine-4 specific n=1 Tax=Phanerochaete carnosa (strain HHB-10118-sp) TaxID=650164 RepID=K5V3L9_PHACS|nr:uncharacterized protein PHACADRAFT_142398 [Phanerochaete carnosa HHB-10118-sp]EKM57176.1 hypothetical protein PHACADRAFT_142398 [Phanerochaete carnosa HHB-10118-sp]